MPARVEGSWVSVTGLFRRKNLRGFVRSVVLRPSLSSPGSALPGTRVTRVAFSRADGPAVAGVGSAPYGFPDSQRPAPGPLAWRLRAQPAGRGRAPCPECPHALSRAVGRNRFFPCHRMTRRVKPSACAKERARPGAGLTPRRTWCFWRSLLNHQPLGWGGREPEGVGRCDGVLCSRLLSPRGVRLPCGGCRRSWGPAGVPSACLSGSPVGAENRTPSAMGA